MGVPSIGGVVYLLRVVTWVKLINHCKTIGKLSRTLRTAY